MRRFLTLLLILTLTALAGCGNSAAAPVPTPTPAPTEAPTPEPTAVPEAPGSGYVTVHMMPVEGTVGEHAVQALVPSVSVTNRDNAATAINAALKERQMPTSVPEGMEDIRRTTHVRRSDNYVLSLEFINACGDEVYSDAVSFDTRTGEEISFAMLSEDEAALRAACLEIWPQAKIADGQWYFNDAGLVLCGQEAGPVPYAVIFQLLKEEWMPPERESVSGYLEAAYTAASDMDALTLLDEVSVAGGMESVALWAEGSVRDVYIASVRFTETDGFQVENSLWTGSMLRNGEAVRLNVTVSEGIPNLMIAWNTDEGSHTAYLAWNGETGHVYLVNAGGETLNDDSPWSHITAEALRGHWYNGKTGAEEQAISFAGVNVCYLWDKGLGYNGEGFLWQLQRRDAEKRCPLLVIFAAKGQLVYEVEALEGNTLSTDKGDFTRAEAVG